MSRQVIADTGGIKNEIVDKSNLNFTELYTLVESTGDLLFDKPFGRRYGTWDVPVTGDLVIDETGAQDGYCVVVVWSGSTTPNVTGGVRGCVIGSIDEQAIYNIYFNRIDGRYNINILKQSTATATAPTITATQDIDSVLTVTNPSVLEFDTLLGYNNYSDQDGQLGTTMTPAEATNGHTVALSDGVVHQVTTKPVGTTNGEFSAVVSNAVEVDLSVATWVDGVFDLDPTYQSKSGTIYTQTTASATLGGGFGTTALLVGDFRVRCAIDEINASGPDAQSKSVIGFHTAQTRSLLEATSMFADNAAEFDVRVNGTAETVDNPTSPVYAVGNFMIVERIGTTLNFIFDNQGVETIVHTYNGYSVADCFMYILNSQPTNNIKDPMYQIL